MSSLNTNHLSSVVSQSDRISMVVFFAIAIHAIIILGISFDLMDNNNDVIITQEITLVNQHSDEAPEEADYLANENQLGGGTQQNKSQPSNPFTNDAPSTEKGFAPNSRRAVSPPPLKQTVKQTEVMQVDKASQKTASEKTKDKMPVTTKSLNVAQLFERSQQIAKISAEIDKLQETFQKIPKRTWLQGANAKKYRFANYLDAWKNKVERIGNLNYPDVIAREKLSGSLLVIVAINPDGSIYSAYVKRSSGYPELDQAALRIVNMAAPFPPLTKEILKDTEVLYIPRVWRFSHGNRLQTSTQ